MLVSSVCSVSSAWRSASRRLCALGGRAASVGVGFVSSSSLSSGLWVLSRSCRRACVFARVRRGASASRARRVAPAFCRLGLPVLGRGWARCASVRGLSAPVWGGGSFFVAGLRWRPVVVARVLVGRGLSSRGRLGRRVRGARCVSSWRCRVVVWGGLRAALSSLSVSFSFSLVGGWR